MQFILLQLLLAILCTLSSSFSSADLLSSVRGHAGQITFSTAPRFSYKILDEEKNAFTDAVISVNPDPPKIGQRLEIKVTGKLAKTIKESSKVSVYVKYQKFIKIIKETFDLCTELGKVGDAPFKCPVEEGDKSWTYGFDIPNGTPPGQYQVDLTIMNQDNDQIIRMQIYLVL